MYVKYTYLSSLIDYLLRSQYILLNTSLLQQIDGRCIYIYFYLFFQDKKFIIHEIRCTKKKKEENKKKKQKNNTLQFKSGDPYIHSYIQKYIDTNIHT